MIILLLEGNLCFVGYLTYKLIYFQIIATLCPHILSILIQIASPF